MNDLSGVSSPSFRAKFTNENTQRRCTIPLEMVLQISDGTLEALFRNMFEISA
jgi:hypothetical protein